MGPRGYATRLCLIMIDNLIEQQKISHHIYRICIIIITLAKELWHCDTIEALLNCAQWKKKKKKKKNRERTNREGSWHETNSIVPLPKNAQMLGSTY